MAPGLKSIHEARLIRQRLLMAFEQAEEEPEPAKRRALLTRVIIGGGPTGVEMSGAIFELGRYMIARDFRNLSPSNMRVILVEAGDRLLAAFPEDLATYAQLHLESIGIEIRLNQRVTDVRADAVSIAHETIPCGCVVWGAGIKPSPAATWFGFSHKHGKVPVDEFLRIEGSTDIFAIGDTSNAIDAAGIPLPALAQVDNQQGEYLGNQLKLIIKRQPTKPFQFHNRGNTAVVGRHAAVFDFGRWKLKGTLAWFLWAIVHVLLLVNFEKRILVSVQWMWRYVTKQRGARLIDENAFEQPKAAATARPSNAERS